MVLGNTSFPKISALESQKISFFLIPSNIYAAEHQLMNADYLVHVVYFIIYYQYIIMSLLWKIFEDAFCLKNARFRLNSAEISSECA